MSLTIQTLPIQTLPIDLGALIFKKLELKDLINVMRVCQAWKQIAESISNLVIDLPHDFIIDKDLSVLGSLLIRAKTITSKSGICLTGNKVTLVAEEINHLGPIKALIYEEYSYKSYIQGPYPGGSSHSLKAYSTKIISDQK